MAQVLSLAMLPLYAGLGRLGVVQLWWGRHRSRCAQTRWLEHHQCHQATREVIDEETPKIGDDVKVSYLFDDSGCPQPAQ